MPRKLNNIRRTATFAWSPGHQLPMMATGTRSGTLDDSFSNASELEIYNLNLDPESNILEPSHKVSTNSRFNTMAWGYTTIEKPFGTIAGGMENGELELWDPSAILDNKSASEALILRNSVHTGTLRALDFNFFQTNLLASAGSNSEVYIWDLNNPTTPYTPGARSSKMDDISSVAWNCQVQHIVSTASTNGYTVVWDLRNKKEVMTLAYAGQLTGGRGSISSIAWHPDVATQIVTASDDDQHPIISLWDLRHAHSPEKTLAGHAKGVLDVSWCRQDSDLLISSGKDCKTLCWNPNTGALNGEVSSNHKWTFEVDWCPRNPDLIATSSFDGTINVFSIQGSEPSETNETPVSDDPFDAALLASQPSHKSFQLVHPPKWLCRPVGASFGFSGKLVTFNKIQQLKITTIETDPEIVKRSEQLESITQSGVEALIKDRIEANEKDKQDWEVLKTLFSDNAREHLMTWLGFEKEQVMAAANALLEEKNKKALKQDVKEQEEENEVKGPKKEESTTDTVSTLFGEPSEVGSESFFGLQVSSPKDSVPITPSSPLIKSVKPFNLYPDTSSETDRLITRAIILGDFESAVNVCLATENFSDALILAMCGGSDLLARTQKVYFESQQSKPYLRLLEGIVQEDLISIVRDASLEEWASILVVLCTFAQSKDFGPLCEILGDRLFEANSNQANLFYLASGNFEKVVKIWIDQLQPDGVLLQAFVEKVTLFRKAIDYEDTAAVTKDGEYVLSDLYDKYCEYAELMAAQGKLSIALKYISLVPAKYASAKSRITSGSVVRDRVYHASSAVATNQQAPLFPFEKTLLSSHQQEPIQLVNPYQKQPVMQQQQTNYYAPVPQQQSSSVGYNNYAAPPAVAPNNQYAPQQAHYAAPAPQYAAPQQYSQVPTQQYGQVPTQQYGQVPTQQYGSTTTPSPPPPHKAAAAGGWNDAPIFPSPKKVTSPAPQAAPIKRVTTPFSNSTSPTQPQPQYGQPQQHIAPPPMNATPPPPMRGLGGPAPPPSSNTTAGVFYSAYQQPQQFLQQQQVGPPPMNAIAPSPVRGGPLPPPPPRF